MIFYIFKKYNLYVFGFKKINEYAKYQFLYKFFWLNKFFKWNDLIWQEGLLLDFIQKKSLDLWLKKFLIFSSYLFNERYLFDKLTRFFINLFILPTHKIFLFEINSVSFLLLFNIFFFLLIFFLVVAVYLFFFIN